MRAAPRELRAIRQGRLLVRYAVLGPITFIHTDLPSDVSGTGLDRPCELEHHGIVIRGGMVIHRPNADVTYEAGTAFYVPPGAPAHTFTTTGPTVAAGFGRTADDTDDSEERIQALGFEIAKKFPLAEIPPPSLRVVGPSFRRSGSIEVESAVMGPWLFMRARFGPASGYVTGWCDLPHWGVVLEGDVAVQSEADAELLSTGDAFYIPGGPPGHRIEAPDGATILDYTPIEALDGTVRTQTWRRAVIAKALGPASEPVTARFEAMAADPVTPAVRNLRLALGTAAI